MSAPPKTRINEILKKYQTEILDGWLKEQAAVLTRPESPASPGERREQAQEFVRLLQAATVGGNVENIHAAEWNDMRDFLTDVSRARGLQGLTPTETAMFVFSFKKPFFARIKKELGNNAESLADEIWAATEMVDLLGLFTTEIYQKTREEVIHRQQRELLELSTPVVQLWDGILALPLIGTLDSSRTQVVMESLLQRIVDTGSDVAIIDITGVPTVDTLVAQHLLKTVTAARLMGAECIISGIRPQIAQTVVHLGVNLGDVITKSNLADAFAVALQKTGASLNRTKNQVRR